MARRAGNPLEPALVRPKRAAALQKAGATVVDVREAYEHNARRIEGSQSIPLTSLHSAHELRTCPVVFYCQTGNRTLEASARLAAIAPAGSVQIAGGLDAWIEAGLPVSGGETANLIGADLLKRLLQSIKKANE